MAAHKEAMANQEPHIPGTSAGAKSDIQLSGWLASLPQWMHPYLILARFDRPIGWWLLLLPGWWVIAWQAADFWRAIWLMGLFLVGAVVMRAAGCVVNDMWDRQIDQKIARTATRPLASGALSLFQAFCFLALLGLIGLGVLVQLPVTAWLAGIASLPLIVIYPLAKRVTGWPQVVLGLTFSWGVVLGAVALSQSWPSFEVWLLYIASVFWVIGYDTIYAVQDMADDRKTGVRSSALSLGNHIKRGVGFFYLLALLFSAYAFFGNGVTSLAILAGWLAASGHGVWQIWQLNDLSPANALRLFKSNRDLGLFLTIGLLAAQLID